MLPLAVVRGAFFLPFLDRVKIFRLAKLNQTCVLSTAFFRPPKPLEKRSISKTEPNGVLEIDP